MRVLHLAITVIVSVAFLVAAVRVYGPGHDASGPTAPAREAVTTR